MKSEYFILALKNMKKRKLRSGLTLLGILIAISAIFILISVSLGLDAAVKEQFRLLGSDKFFVQPAGQAGGPGSGGAVTLNREDVGTLEKVPGVRRVSYGIVGNTKVESDEEKRYTMTIGIDLESADLFEETGAYKAEQGRLLKKGDTFDVMLGSQYGQKNFFKKPIEVGDKILVNEQEFNVRGVLKTVGNPQDDRLVYMPEKEFRELFNIPERIDQIIVQVDSGANIKEIADNAERKLIKAREVTKETKDFIILTPEELLESFGTILNIVTAFLVGVAAISLFVGAIGIANTIYTSVLERTREIGVMKAIGAKNKDILTIFLIEAGLLGLTGGILGISLGIAVSKGIEYYAINSLGTNLLRAAIPVYLILGCLVFSFLVGAVSGIWPAWKATKIKPVEALRYE